MESPDPIRRLSDDVLKQALKGKDIHAFKAALKKLPEVAKALKNNKNFDVLIDKAGRVVLEGNLTKVLIPLGKTIEELNK